MNGADVLCETLLLNGIDVCFANPGTSEMHFVAALDRQPKIRCVLGLFEGVVTGAADGFARMTDRPAATLLHLGPGLANGLANLHNARRAFSPMVNVVGDHATQHLAYDAPLTSDIESLARPMSGWIGRAQSADDVGRQTARAITEANRAPGAISTLILPADAAWGEVHSKVPSRATRIPADHPDPDKIREAAEALRGGKNTTILVSGTSLRAENLKVLSQIAAMTGSRLMAQQSNSRMQRGAGRVVVDRVPFAIDKAIETFAETEQIILIGAKAPVGFFAYPGKPSSMLPPACIVLDMAPNHQDLTSAINLLADEIGLSVKSNAIVAMREKPPMSRGALTPEAISIALAHHMPENSIICDESVSSGRDFFRHTYGAEPHDFLQLTGGSIGIGLPLAVGAAIACPDRKVITLQADGSGMYTVQALWTQARERLDILTIVYANQCYNILHGELKQVGAGVAGVNASRMLDLVDPTLDWVGIANGMGVEAVRVDTVEGFESALKAACQQHGPFLIEAMI
ncbi:acetolactate synthase large subunit [Ochrobactrum sp. BTU1]|uniref:acetolactate synthase large subunit n=1 Tax=Ochrobactrum sp. BTU1 TaxID=2840456 RepID=UPI001C0594E6|nr:acetolactate synthase large subunit [Ochrobactrum sp. BTU1]